MRAPGIVVQWGGEWGFSAHGLQQWYRQSRFFHSIGDIPLQTGLLLRPENQESVRFRADQVGIVLT